MYREFTNWNAGRATEDAAECDLLIHVPTGAGIGTLGDVSTLDAMGDARLTDLLDLSAGDGAFGLPFMLRLPVPPRGGLWRCRVVAYYDRGGEIATVQITYTDNAALPWGF
ncbi:MAG: hypothetical protein KC583_17585 [Myxococcales bacterium]|nr:hypothetical protein [Myxococcales bacterium]